MIYEDMDQSELDIYWNEEAKKQRERTRRTDEADGYQEEKENEPLLQTCRNR